MRRYLSLSKASRRNSSYLPEVTEEGNAAEKKTSPEQPSPSGSSVHGGDESVAGDISSTTALVTPTPALPPPSLKVKRVDHYWSSWSKTWKYKNMGAKVTPEASHMLTSSGSGNDPWGQFCFVVVRKLPRNPEESEATFQVVIKSPYLISACKHVVGEVPGISWTAEPLELDPQILIAFLPGFESYHDELKKKKGRSTEEGYILSSIAVLIEYLRKDYRSTLASIASLTTHGEITFNLLYAVMVPRTILVTECPSTGEPRALQLMSATKILTMSGGFYDLLCESIDAVDQVAQNLDSWGGGGGNSVEAEVKKAGGGKPFGRVQNRVIIPAFKGAVKINSLDAYPLKFHHAQSELKLKLLARGKKWVEMKGIHHMQYKGSAAWYTSMSNGNKKLIKYNVNSRIMVDRGNFKRLNPNYDLPVIKAPPPPPPPAQGGFPGNMTPPDPNRGIPTLRVQVATQQEEEVKEMTDDELMLTSPTVYGFSLADKLWLEFNIEIVQDIEWNDEAFRSLVLPTGRKTLLQSLVEAHNMDLGFDDFIQGKGHGLVINLYGPPGVGKTLSAEATSEHVKRPLYVVGAGDLGTSAAKLDEELQNVFDIATSWKAIVLIDEADVFLEERSLHDLERNAMVAVFLRHVEYYRGILFLTTNRVKAFDEAFLSRIHVALHFQELTKSAKKQVWRSFLGKAGVEISAESGFTETYLDRLADRDINGRQIKNATRTANSLAVSRKEKLGFRHLVETLDAMEEFTQEFHEMAKKNSMYS
ncbi:P-loop containing nucleoside triphosphate hydrolase protein [Cristinia sonorae]|uniref:P-loop containing nucleoside triphosphate hydrolase protein n=1 Tax=Cristinia sonorae TaxID=1940300 RepID=A0A8K0UF91_9AGAR|nr:P-loop containing nucleoside triphosphate hydrolase protein [Cristinia sonorae]